MKQKGDNLNRNGTFQIPHRAPELNFIEANLKAYEELVESEGGIEKLM